MTTRTMLKSKIHRARVTEANLEYEGSVSIAPELLAAANIAPYERVEVWNCSNGSRLSTYAIAGDAPGEICMNGAAAHLVRPGDIVIIASFVQAPEAQVQGWQARRVFVDARNRIVP